MKYICIDLGGKRCGIATSSEDIAFAHKVLIRTELMKFLKAYISNHAITGIVVWLPYDLYNTDTRQLDKTKRFITKLTSVFPEIPVIGHDERFSSFEAAQWHDDHRDDVAAQCILQSYLDSLKK